MIDSASEIYNLSESKFVRADLDSFITRALESLPESQGKYISIAFANDSEIQKLNLDFRGKDMPTDILSFPATPEKFEDPKFLGEIVISNDRAKEQAAENGLSLELELKQLILHGIIHLCGYDHETDDGEMNDTEHRLRAKLSINS